MIELAQHIEALLLENDCVIVPGLGGFVAHYNPALRVEEENLFFPPTRVIGFNPQLKMNDGLLVQSYMAVYGTNFPDATKKVDYQVKQLIATLHEDGKVDLPNIGKLSYSIYQKYDFLPYDNRITTPFLYGFDSFEMISLSKLDKTRFTSKKTYLEEHHQEKHHTGIRLNPTYITTAAAVIAAVVLSFFFSVPIENTGVIEENYAQILPDELFEKLSKESLAITPIVINRPDKSSSPKKAETNQKRTAPISAREVKVRTSIPTSESKLPVKSPEKAPSSIESQTNRTSPKVAPSSASKLSDSSNKTFHVIIASVGTEQDAKTMASNLNTKGYANAKAIIGDGKMRVSIESCSTEAEAYKVLAKIKENSNYQSAWILKK